jgi:hypothetical protein
MIERSYIWARRKKVELVDEARRRMMGLGVGTRSTGLTCVRVSYMASIPKKNTQYEFK